MRCKAVLLTLVLGAAMASGCSAVRIEDFPCPEEGTELTYNNFGKAFLDRECQWCHGTAGSDRRGAPSAFDFGSYKAVTQLKSRIFVRSAATNTTMPPGPDDPPEEERMKLAIWLACGAPE